MAYQFDDRIVKVTIELEGFSKTYASPFTIIAYGTKYANDLQSEADIIIQNIDAETRNYILTAVSPFNKNYSPKNVILEAGRVSYGTKVVYVGNIVTANLTQPPDIGIVLKCLTGNYVKGNPVTQMQAGNVSLETVAKSIANSIGVGLKFEAQNINLPGGFSTSGGALDQISVLNQYGNINAFLDNDVLIVKDGPVGLKGTLATINKDTGMIDIPEFTEQGIAIRFLLNPSAVLGGYIDLKCSRYPTMDGRYIIYKLNFEITSRDRPFYYIAECIREGFNY